jgi:glutaminyl-peptide cyclotransferase
MAVRILPIVLVCLLPLAAGCNSAETAAQDREKKTKQREEFAQDQVVDLPKPAAFDSARAMKYLRELCALGPRISGSDGIGKLQERVKEHFEKLGAKVTFQRFEAKQRSQAKATPMANVIISWRPDAERRVLISSHYDTRPIADKERDRRNWTKPFISANDGTSGVAWMMELGHHMKDLPLNVGVDFILFDGEEYIFEPAEGRDEYFFGSKEFARDYRRDPPKHRYVAGVLLDLFAGNGATYPIEGHSMYSAGAVVDDIWKTADRLGVKAFRNATGPTVLDDHLALNDAGIPTVDIIDFDYAHWHRLSDTPDMCSEEAMSNVAKVLSVWAQKVK